VKRFVVVVVVLLLGGVGLVALGTLGIGPIVITGEGQQKIILLFGTPRKVTLPGPDLRIPLLEEVRSYERRLLYLNTEPLPIQTRDEERLVVDNYVVWTIDDPIAFHASFPGGPFQAEAQIDRIVRADVREVVGRHTLPEVLTDRRGEVMSEITARSDSALEKDGISIQDVRINRTELPKGTEANVYARMKTERERLARKYRAEGEEKARVIRAEADREALVIVAHARRESELVRGEGDARAAAIYAEAYEKAPLFYDFLRSLQAYRKTIGKGTTLVFSPKSDFFRYLLTPSPDIGNNGASSR
jgi:membrane protease subunit HflC